MLLPSSFAWCMVIRETHLHCCVWSRLKNWAKKLKSFITFFTKDELNMHTEKSKQKFTDMMLFTGIISGSCIWLLSFRLEFLSKNQLFFSASCSYYVLTVMIWMILFFLSRHVMKKSELIKWWYTTLSRFSYCCVFKPIHFQPAVSVPAGAFQTLLVLLIYLTG